MIEQLFFITLSVILFGFIFIKMLKSNDTEYVIFLLIQALGILFDAIYMVTGHSIGKYIIYFMSIILPIIVLILEFYNNNFIENLKIFRVKFYVLIGNNKKAKDILIAITEKNIHNYEAHRLLAQIYESEGGLRKSIDEYVFCIDINKKDYNSYYKVSKLLVELAKKDEAIEMLTRLLNKKPDYCEACITLSDLLIEKERYKEAIIILNDTIKYHPENYDLNYELGIVYTMLNDFQNAKQYYEKAAEINSLNYNTKYSLAQIALLYKEIDKAETLFEQTLNSEDLQADSYYELAKIKLIKGQKDLAIKYINIAIDIESKRISEKVKNEPVFIPIMAKISIPFNLETKEVVNLTVKEQKVKQHLENTANITMNMGYVNLNKKEKKDISYDKEITMEKEN